MQNCIEVSLKNLCFLPPSEIEIPPYSYRGYIRYSSDLQLNNERRTPNNE